MCTFVLKRMTCMNITNTENYAIKRIVHIVLKEVKTR